MLSLIFLPLELAVGIILLPLRIILGMFRASRFMAIIMIAGVCSIFSGIISMIFGSLQSLLPWILIAVGIALCAPTAAIRKSGRTPSTASMPRRKRRSKSPSKAKATGKPPVVFLRGFRDR